MSIRATTTTVLAALAAFGLAQSAAAQTRHADPDAVAVKVSYADLNLSSPAGAKTLLHRVREAAKEICGEPDRDLTSVALNQACVKSMTDRAVVEINNPVVTALANGQSAPAHPGLALAYSDR